MAIDRNKLKVGDWIAPTDTGLREVQSVCLLAASDGSPYLTKGRKYQVCADVGSRPSDVYLFVVCDTGCNWYLGGTDDQLNEAWDMVPEE